jgi:hypothetical protein
MTRLAILLDITSHTLVASPLTQSSAVFCAFTGLSSVAATAVPITQSLALSLFNRSPANVQMGVGALFGAMSALQAVGQMIVGVCPFLSSFFFLRGLTF